MRLSKNRQINRRLMYECRCGKRLKAKADGSTRLTRTVRIPVFVVYYESIKREIKRRLIYEYRCDERLTLTLSTFLYGDFKGLV